MPRVELHGGSPLYLGQIFNSETDLLTELATLFTNAGQTVTDEIESNKRILIEGIDGSDRCWIEAKTVDNSGILDGKKLVLRGDLDGTGAILSPDNVVTFEFIDRATNRLWAVADEAAGAIAIAGFGTQINGYNFGFYERHTQDPYAWGVFSLENDWTKMFVAQGAYDSSNWFEIADYGYSSLLEGATYSSSPAQGVLDPAAISSSGASFTSTSASNNSYLANLGAEAAYDELEIAANSDGKTTYLELGDRYVLEGKTGGYISPGNNSPVPFYFRGKMRHVINGVAASPGGAIIEDLNGGVYLSCGNPPAQGIILVEPAISTAAALTPLFFNGGSDYLGEIFTTTQQLLEEISGHLNTAGWTIYDNISASSSFIAEGTTNDSTTGSEHKCWLEFKVTGDSYATDGKRLSVRGDLDNTQTSMSPDNLWLRFIEGAQNRYWLTLDHDSCIVTIKDFNGDNMLGIHGGFCDRTNKNNPFEWSVGYVDNLISQSYVAKNPLDSTQEWHEVKSSFANTTYTQNGVTGAFEGVLDRYTTALKAFQTYRNAGYPSLYAHNGSVNALDNKPVYGSYYYRVGNGDPQSYGSANYRFSLKRLGNIKYAAVGAASLPGGSIDTDINGLVYMSVGNNQIDGGLQAGQAMRVN